jgi:hypothetical protein
MNLFDNDIDEHIDGIDIENSDGEDNGSKDKGMRTDPDSEAEEEGTATMEVNPEDPEDNKLNIEIYMKAVRADSEKVKKSTSKNGVLFGICGYRVFILMRGDFKLETVQKKIMEENHNIRFNYMKDINNKGSGKRALCQYEKYRNIITKADLVAASRLYANANTLYFQT